MMCVCEWENVLTTFGIHNKSELHQMVLILGRDCGPRGPGRLEVERRMSRSLLLSLSEVQTNASEARTATSLHSAESCAARISLGTRIERWLLRRTGGAPVARNVAVDADA